MKKILLSIGLLSSLASWASELCPYNVIPSTGKVISLPIYGAKVMYIFNSKTRQAFAKVDWKIDETESIICLNQNKTLFPHYQTIIAEVSPSHLKASILGGLDSKEVSFHQQANGHFFGSAGYIPVDFKSKDMVKDAISNNEKLITVEGEFYYKYEAIEETQVAKIPCVKGPVTGVLNLRRRLSEITTELQKTNPNGVDKRVVLDQFITSCVDLKPIEERSILGFKKNFLQFTELKNGAVPVFGAQSRLRLEPLDPVLRAEITVHEI